MIRGHRMVFLGWLINQLSGDWLRPLRGCGQRSPIIGVKKDALSKLQLHRNRPPAPFSMRKNFRFPDNLEKTEAPAPGPSNFNLLLHIHERSRFHTEPGPERPLIPGQPSALLVQQAGVGSKPELAFGFALEPLDDRLLGLATKQRGKGQRQFFGLGQSRDKLLIGDKTNLAPLFIEPAMGAPKNPRHPRGLFRTFAGAIRCFKVMEKAVGILAVVNQRHGPVSIRTGDSTKTASFRCDPADFFRSRRVVPFEGLQAVHPDFFSCRCRPPHEHPGLRRATLGVDAQRSPNEIRFPALAGERAFPCAQMGPRLCFRD